MSKIIEIIEENNELRLSQENAKIICGNSNYKLKFTLTEDWKNANHKAVVFCVCGKKITQTMVYDECEVPVFRGGGILFVALVAGDEGNELATTEVKIELVETFSNVNLVEYEPLKNNLSSLLDAVNDIEKGNLSVKRAGVAENVSNPNLLINGDFKVNQRGQTTYTETGKYTVDRWKLLSGSLEVVSDGIKLNGTITQKLEHAPTGDVVCSVDTTGGNPSISYSNGAVTITTTSATLIKWAKLEVGTTPTIFSPKHYAEELALCQRYYVKILASSTYQGIAVGYATSTTRGDFVIYLQQVMRVKPTLSTNGKFRIYFGSASTTSANFTLSNDGMTTHALYIGCTPTGTNFQQGQSLLLRVDEAGADISLDSEIY